MSIFDSYLGRDELEQDKSPSSPSLKLKNYNLILKNFSAELVEKCSSATIKIIIKDESKPKVSKAIKGSKTPIWDQEFILSPLFIDGVDVIIKLLDKDEVLGSFSYKIDTIGTPKDYKLQLTKENQCLSFNMGLNRLVKKKEICFLDFSEDFNKKGYVRDITGKMNNFQVKTIEGKNPKIGDGLDYESYGIQLLGKNYLECLENFLNNVYEFSISIWFNADELKDYPLISTQVLSFEVYCFKTILYDNIGNISVETSSDSLKKKYIEKEWNHKVITYSGTFIREYLNGSLINEVPLKKSTIKDCKSLFIGGRFILNIFEGFIGNITKIHFYDYVLSKDEVENLFKKE